MSVMAERETVIDFTVPYYDLVGIAILMQLPSTPSSLFKFLTVLETNVWLCILAAYLITRYLYFRKHLNVNSLHILHRLTSLTSYLCHSMYVNIVP